MSRAPIAEAVLRGAERAGWWPAAAGAGMPVDGVPNAVSHWLGKEGGLAGWGLCAGRGIDLLEDAGGIPAA